MNASILCCAYALLTLPLSINAAAVQWAEPVEIAVGPGERGAWQQNDSRYDYVDDPAVAVADNGDALVVWVDQSRKAVFLTRVGAGESRVREPINVSHTPDTFSWLPRIALHPRDSRQIFVVWQEIIFSGGAHGGDILYARSNDGGRTFSKPLNLSRSIGGDGKGRINRDVWDNGSLDIAVNDDGNVYAVWTEYDGPLWIARSADGNTFSRPVQIAGGKGTPPARAPSIAVGAGEDVYIAWTHGERADADIHISSSSDGGIRFGQPRKIATTRNYSDKPSLAVGDQGAVHVVFAESEGGPFDAQHIRYTQSQDGGRTFDAPRMISHPLPSGSVAASAPSIEVGANGAVHVQFELHPHASQRARGLALTSSANQGREFSPPAMVPASVDRAGGSNGSQQGSLTDKLAIGGDTHIAVVNSSFKADEQSRVWLIRGTHEAAAAK